MACWRYDNTTRTWYEIKPSQVIRPDRGTDLTFKQQIMRGYQRAEAKGERINGSAGGIKRIWGNN